MKKPAVPALVAALLMLCVVAWLGLAGGAANAFDRDAVLDLARTRADAPTLTAFVIALTWLGSAYATLGGLAAAAAWRWLEGNRAVAVWTLATVAGGRLLAEAIKLLVGRPRPHFGPYPVPVSSLSFPSGHATNSMLAFTAIALIFAPLRHRIAALSVAVAVSIAIGLTRPYLGVHWPSDVLAGWTLGGAVMLLAAPSLPSGARIAA